jgi:hypothetical protein
MELGGASQGLTGADVAGALLGVVDDDDGDGVAALQLAQIGEQRRHFAAGVLIDAMQAHEGIEDSASRSSRTAGAVMTWTSRSARPRPAAAQMPSSRRRTMWSASSAA